MSKIPQNLSATPSDLLYAGYTSATNSPSDTILTNSLIPDDVINNSQPKKRKKSSPTPNNSNPNNNNNNFFPTNFSIVKHQFQTMIISLHMLHSVFAIIGHVSIKVLTKNASVEILGYELSSSSSLDVDVQTIQSPSFSANVTVMSLSSDPVSVELTDLDFSIETPSSSSLSIIDPQNNTIYSLPPPPTPHPSSPRTITIPESWRIAASKISSSSAPSSLSTFTSTSASKTLICGAKGVGKSTYLRYLVNKTLTDNKHKQKHIHNAVAVLDIDCGQPEFSPPGLLSITIITKPLLSPPPANLTTSHAKAYFFGDVTSKNDPVKYTALVAKLVAFYHSSLSHLPLIVNTDGWVKSLGYNLLCSVIGIISPSNIVQIIGGERASGERSEAK